MLKTRFGKTGWHVTPLGFGAAEIGFLKPERERAARVLNLLLDEGVNVIDTAAGYDTSEEIIGEAIAHRRSQFVLVSKCGHGADLAAQGWSPEHITQSIDRSLSRLKLECIDVMLLHTCDEATLRKGEALGALVKARQAGKIRFAGYSGDNQAAAYAATLPEIAVIETSISIADQANIDLVLPIARKHDVGLLAKRPIANAAWRPPRDRSSFYVGYVQPYVDRLAKMNLDPANLGFSGDPAMAWPELALRFTLSQAGVNTAIIGTTSPQNAQRNVEFAKKGPLPKEIVEKIRDAFRAGQAQEGFASRADNWPGLA
jgi:aryl-alcohol dehydrogenase-like predicted oxidoreductase